MLSDALLDAEVKIGELLKQIPTKPRIENLRKDTSVPSVKNKSEVVKELGFTEKQKQHFETLADNKDLVEQVKTEARENDDIPTRSRVLELAKQRKEEQRKPSQADLHTAEIMDTTVPYYA